MSKVAVVFWSSSGNTETMAEAVLEGAKGAGAEAEMINCADFNADMVDQYDGIALGCPAMGDEVLEEDEFQPLYDACKGKLAGKKVALFGYYGWGDGEWMRDWTDRMTSAGATVVNGEGLICHETPDEDGLSECVELGKALAQNA